MKTKFQRNDRKVFGSPLEKKNPHKRRPFNVPMQADVIFFDTYEGGSICNENPFIVVEHKLAKIDR